MPNLREALAATAYANLDDGWSERPIDRVRASARADSVGLDILKARNGLEAHAFARAVGGLVARYLCRYKHEPAQVATHIVHQCLTEYIANFCVSCIGTGQVMSDDLLVQCPSCLGSKLRNYTDAERARMTGLSYGKVVGSRHKFAWVHDYIGTLDRGVNAVMVYQLERD